MIPTFLDMLFKRYQTHQYKVLILLVALSVFAIANAQETNLVYTIKRHGGQIGYMNVKEVKAGTKTSYKLESLIKTKFIFTFTAKGTEEASYENGVLQSSSVYQKLNGNERVNKKTKFTGTDYVITDDGSEEKFDSKAINYNMVCLYTKEPFQISHVFSEKFQAFIPIQKMNEHHYKISFPDGNYNEYYYNNGTCTKIEVSHSLYSAVMELKL